MDIDRHDQSITVRDSFDTSNLYPVPYDILIYGVGARSASYGIAGVEEHAYFLKQVRDAMAIREKIQELFERASKPTTTQSERERLLSIVVCGGGPSSLEFLAELHDFCYSDGVAMFPELIDCVSITLIEASNRILSAFGEELGRYSQSILRKRKIKVLLNSQVIKVTGDFVELADGHQVIHGGLVIFCAGIEPQPLTRHLDWPKSPNGRLIINNRCLVDFEKSKEKEIGADYDLPWNHVNVFAIGDAAMNLEHPLPPTAQVAKQEGYYVGNLLNSLLEHPVGEWEERYREAIEHRPTFLVSVRGIMANLGGWKAVVSLGNIEKDKDLPRWRQELRKRLRFVYGIQAYIFWRSTYLSMIMSWSNKVLIPMYWTKALIFGRDFTRF